MKLLSKKGFKSLFLFLFSFDSYLKSGKAEKLSSCQAEALLLDENITEFAQKISSKETERQELKSMEEQHQVKITSPQTQLPSPFQKLCW